MNQYFLSQQSATSSCDFNGLGKVVSPDSNPNSTCQNLLSQAGAAGTQTITSLPAITPASTSTGSNGGSSPTGTLGGGGSQPGDTTQSSGGGLSAGAKAGIAIAAVAVVLIVAVLAYLWWRRKHKVKDPQLSGEGGLEVGDAPPEFTTLQRAEMEANETQKEHLINRAGLGLGGTHDVHADRVNELDATRERQELDSTGVTSQAVTSELDGATAAPRGELSGDSTSRSPRRKPIAGTIPPVPDPPTQTTASASWFGFNQPWSDPGAEGLTTASPVTQRTPEAAEAAEAIAESERLQELRREKEELQRRRMEMRSKMGSGDVADSTALK
jgi:transposase-like protein